jgi:hypothetical protein
MVLYQAAPPIGGARRPGTKTSYTLRSKMNNSSQAEIEAESEKSGDGLNGDYEVVAVRMKGDKAQRMMS